ncbi:MAG: AhpC/TSA family protein [Egibacteraceae bacterium]
MFCREQAAQLRDHHEAILEAGADIAAVGTGNAEMARAFRDERGIEFPLLLDDGLRSYRAVGAGRGTLAQMVQPSMLAVGLRALRGGHRQGQTGKHPLLLGATHVIRPDGCVPFAWVNADFADNAPIDEVLATL